MINNKRIMELELQYTYHQNTCFMKSKNTFHTTKKKLWTFAYIGAKINVHVAVFMLEQVSSLEA